MTEPRDELLERYAEAIAQDPRRPSERVRNAARAHAQMLRNQASDVQRAEGIAPAQTAANQPRWRLSLVASLAVVGLAGLLYVQIDQGESQDREIALGAPPPGAVPAPTALPTLPAQKAAPALAKTAPPSVYSVEPAEAAPRTAKQMHTAAQQIARAETAVPETRNETREESAARAAPSPVYAPAPAAPAAATPTVVAAAPAVADTSRSRQALVVGTAASQFLQAARGGQVEALQRLLAQGVAINTRDDKGNTALMLAVTHRQLHAVRTLLDMGADPALVNNEGWTALRLASELDMPGMVLLLQTPR
jgi:hypothetical protein